MVVFKMVARYMTALLSNDWHDPGMKLMIIYPFLKSLCQKIEIDCLTRKMHLKDVFTDSKRAMIFKTASKQIFLIIFKMMAVSPWACYKDIFMRKKQGKKTTEKNKEKQMGTKTTANDKEKKLKNEQMNNKIKQQHLNN